MSKNPKGHQYLGTRWIDDLVPASKTSGLLQFNNLWHIRCCPWNPQNLRIWYVTWQNRIRFADEIKVANHLTLKLGGYFRLSG
jgi:hypothetical protein